MNVACVMHDQLALQRGSRTFMGNEGLAGAVLLAGPADYREQGSGETRMGHVHIVIKTIHL